MIRIYLQAVIDNFSRRILAWRVSDTLSSATTRELLIEASKGLPDDSATANVLVVTDGGSENLGEVNQLLRDSSSLHRVLAQIDIISSNSLIEAFWRQLKRAWLFLNTLDSAAAVRRLVAFYVREHNEKIPRAVLGARTPDEVYFSREENLRERLSEQRKTAQRVRSAANRAANCHRCESSHAGPAVRSVVRPGLVENLLGNLHDVCVSSTADDVRADDAPIPRAGIAPSPKRPWEARARNSLRVFMACARVMGVRSFDGRVNSEIHTAPSSVHYHARAWGRMQAGPRGCILEFMSDTDRFQRAIRSIDEANGEDPNSEVVDGVAQPKELLYGVRMQEWVEKLDSRAPEALRIAARSQHIRRWEIPRSDYPMDRKGYLRWRTTLYAFHAEKASELLRATGYDDETIERVQTLLQKRNLRTDADVQTLEDAAALVFLVHHLDDFLKRDDIGEEKAIDIIRKTWKKMTERGHEAASALELSAESTALLKKALTG